MSDNRAATFGSMAREEFSHFLAGASEILGQFGLTKPANTVYLGEDNEVYVRINTRSSTEYGPYYLSDGGTIQFFKHDKPAEFYGKEACLVRNDTVRGLYVIRAPEGTGVNSLYRYKHLFEEREAAVERQKQYESGRPYVHEREVGVNCGHVSPVVVAQDPPQTPIRPLPVPPTAPIAPHGVIFGTPVFLDPIHRGFGTNGSFDGKGNFWIPLAGHRNELPAIVKRIQNFLETSVDGEVFKLEQGHWTPNATSDDPKPIFQIREYPNGRLLTLNSGGWGRGFTSPLVLNGEAGGATADGVITTIGFMGTPRSPFIFGADASRWNEDDDQVSGANPTSTDLPARHLDKRTNTLYKTEMCRNWNEVGDCRYGRSCQFAHGQKELRPVVRHGQWKTKTCMAWLNGGCTYGSRCCYAHEIIPDPDMKVNNQDYDPRDPSGSSGDDLTGFDFQGTLTHT